MIKKIFFISTNRIWSGSEILWYEAALRLISTGTAVGIATYYENHKIQKLLSLQVPYLNLNTRFKRFSLIDRFLTLLKFNVTRKDNLDSLLRSLNPDVIIISQGSAFGSLNEMELCSRLNIKYITITQLVTELHWLNLNNKNHSMVKWLYNKAEKNFFVSKANLHIHEFTLSDHSDNNEVIFNPAVIKNEAVLTFPDTSLCYRIAFVGRLECFHKGLDILLNVLSQNKWKRRPVLFNFYGNGPHLDFINDIINKSAISNVFIKGFAASVEEVWKENHILILPSRMEGQSLALLEALACGRTAIVTDVGGVREIIDDNVSGFIARAHSVFDLDEAMERAWERRSEWQSIGKAAKRAMEAKMPDDAIGYFIKKMDFLI